MDTVLSSGGGRSASMRCVAALLLIVTLPGCAVFKSAYITEKEVAACGYPTHAAPYTHAAELPGSDAARCTARSFESALRDHAHFSNALGEVLIPLASLVAYKGFSGGNEHNIAALASGGAAMYGIGTYIYKKPREAIYITGLSGIACAERLTDLRTLDPADRSYLLGATGHAVPGADHEHRQGFDAAMRRDTNIALASEGQERLAAALDTSVIARAGCSTAQIAEFETTRKAALARVQLRSGDIAELRQRLARVDLNARRLLKADRHAQRDLLRAVEQIRIDINHMLVAQTPDPASLQETLAVLKVPEAAPDVEQPVTQEPPIPDDDGPGLRNALLNDADKLNDELRRSPGQRAKCDLASISSEIRRHELELAHIITAAKDALDTMERRIALLAPSDAEQQPVHEQCAVADMNVPQPLRLVDGGTVKLLQGESTRVALAGGKAPFNHALGSDPAAGTIETQILGNSTLGRVLEIKASADATPGDYNVLLWDGGSGRQTVKVTIAPKAA